MSNSRGVRFEKTLVALLDIQAYSDFINKTAENEVISRSRKLFDFAKSAASTNFGTVKTQFWILSDTVVIAIDTNVAPLSFASAYLFIVACSSFFHDALKFCNFPMRGAIGAGYLYFEDDPKGNEFGDRSFLLGDALVDAATEEKRQDWLGISFTQRAVEAIRSFSSDEDGMMILASKKLSPFCACGKIPLKGDAMENNFRVGYYLLPAFSDPKWRTYLPEHFDSKRFERRIQHSEKLWIRD